MNFTSHKDCNTVSPIKFESSDTTDVCRTCLCRSLKMISLFDSRTVNICERIYFCTGLKFIMEDPLPSNICNMCLDKLTVAYNFKAKCLQIDRKLWAYYSKSDSANINKVYVQEPEVDQVSCEDIKEEEELIEDNADVLNSEDLSDVELSRNGERDIPLLINMTEEKEMASEMKINKCIMRSPMETDKSEQCLHKDNIHQGRETKRTKFRRLFCESCNLRFNNKHDSDEHKNTVHKDEAWVCQHCGKTSTKKSAYYYHMNCHFKKGLPESDGVKSDGRPSMKGRKRLGVKRGPYKKRTVVSDAAADCVGSVPEGLMKKPRRKFKLNKEYCEKCDVRFENDQEFIAHKRDVHKHIYLCEICGRVFYNRDARFSHMTSHERPKFACDHCDYSTTRKQDLIKHLYVHNGVKRYQCEYCPLSFYTASNLQHHLRRHRDGPHVCAVCDKQILDRYSFKRHMDTHNGGATVTQFTCQLCGSRFRRSSRLNQHMLKRHNVRTPPQRPGRRRIEPSDLV